jgi:hypothetical protein
MLTNIIKNNKSMMTETPNKPIPFEIKGKHLKNKEQF